MQVCQVTKNSDCVAEQRGFRLPLEKVVIYTRKVELAAPRSSSKSGGTAFSRVGCLG